VKLFEPGKIGSLVIKNRVVMSAMGTGLIEQDGRLSQNGIDYYIARAKGGVGLILTSTTLVSQKIEYHPDIPVGLTRIDDEKTAMSWLRPLAEGVHQYGAKVAVQLCPGLGTCASPVLAKKVGAVGASRLNMVYDPSIVTRELTLQEIKHLVQAMGIAAGIVKSAGIDAIEINGHGGYIIDEFMTSLWNKRKDGYGGSLDNRLKFIFEVIQSIREAVGADFPLSCKFALTHGLEGAREIEEGSEIVRRLEAAGLNSLSIDAGCHAVPWLSTPATTIEPGLWVDLAGMVKKVVKIPVIAVGKLGYPDLAEKVLKEGKADFISLGRALLADPDWANKVQEKRWEDIRPCIGDNEGCIHRSMINGSPVSCTLNPSTGMEKEYEIKPAEKRKTVLVIGGGPGGMEAARVAALRGHNVTIWEKGYTLGGNLRLSSVPDFKQDYRRLVNYLSTQVKKLGVTVKFGIEATPEKIQEFKPDAVILATGAIPFYPEIPGRDGDNVTSSLDIARMFSGLLKWDSIKKKKGWQKLIWLAGNAFSRYLTPATISFLSRFWLPFGKNVVIIGGNYTGCEMALLLAQRGRNVTVVESSGLDNVCDMCQWNRAHMLKLMAEANVEILPQTHALEITEKGVIVVEKDGKRKTLEADTIMLTVELKPNPQLLEKLKGKVSEVYSIGDSIEPRKVIGTIWDGFNTARVI